MTEEKAYCANCNGDDLEFQDSKPVKCRKCGVGLTENDVIWTAF